jgi:hypothetical protein
MTEKASFANLTENTHQALQRLSEAVRNIPAPKVEIIQFSTDRLDPDNEPIDLTASVDAWDLKGHRFIYFLTADAEDAALRTAYARYSDAKARELDGRAYARLNEPTSNQFYVGSSLSLGRRFREHLGYGSRRTYALHLAYWSLDLRLSLQLTVARYAPGVPETLIGALEDQLWVDLSPMFGRQGRR